MSIHKLLFCEKNKEKVEIGGVFMRQADVEFTVRTDLALEERREGAGKAGGDVFDGGGGFAGEEG